MFGVLFLSGGVGRRGAAAVTPASVLLLAGAATHTHTHTAAQADHSHWQAYTL